MHWIIVPVCGMMTASFGGVIRDLLCQQKPWIMHRESGLYASTALGGATAFVTATHFLRLPVSVGLLSCIGVCVSMRYVSWQFGVGLPKLELDVPQAS